MNWYRKFHRITGLLSPTVMRRLRRITSIEPAKIQLGRRWQKFTIGKKGKIDLWYLIIHLEDPYKTEACEMLLTREDITLEDIYELLSIFGDSNPETILEKLSEIGAAPSNLLYLVNYGLEKVSNWAFEEIIRRIKENIISKDYGIRILTDIIKKNPRRREDAWKELKKLKPDEEHLLVIADLTYATDLHRIISEAQKILRALSLSKTKKKEPSRTVLEIIALSQRMKEIKGQE